jgi:uncharacterized protein (TIRG00374 family)
VRFGCYGIDSARICAAVLPCFERLATRHPTSMPARRPVRLRGRDLAEATCQHEGMRADPGATARRSEQHPEHGDRGTPAPNEQPIHATRTGWRARFRVRRELRIGLTVFGLALVVEYLVLPQIAGVRRSLTLLGHANVGALVAGVALEAAALVAYAQLTHAVLTHDAPSRTTLLRVNLSGLAVSHVAPGGTAAGTPVIYRLLVERGVQGADAAFALAAQGVGSAVVLNVIFWLALVISIPLHGYNPIYGVAAAAGALLLAAFAAVLIALTKGRRRTVELVRRLVRPVPLVAADRVVALVERVADRLRTLLGDPPLLRRAIVWAAANWLLDAASLWVFVAAFGHLVFPVDLLVAYGLANILAVIPITPSGLGVIEGVLIPTLAGFRVPKGIAILGVLSYRLVNFWLPIPVGGATYLSLRLDRRAASAAGTNSAARPPGA